MAIPGNLFSELTEIFVPDISGWSGTGGTLAGVTGSVLGGANKTVLRLTATGGAPAEILSVEAPAVTPGSRYLAYGWGIVEAGSVPVRAEVRWYDDSDTLLSADSVSWTLPAVVATRLNVGGTAPAGAASARLAVVLDSPAAGQYVFFDQMYLGVEPNAPGNLLTYDEYSMEYSQAGWETEGGTIEHRLNRQAIGEGAYLLEVTPSERGIVTMSLERQIPVTPGETYAVATYVYTRAGGDPNASVTARPSVRWFTESGTQLDDGAVEPFATVSGTQTYVGLQSSRTRTAPAGASYAVVQVQVDHTPNTTATSYLVDRVSLLPSDPEYTITTSDTGGYVTLTIDVVPPGGPTHFSVYRVDEDGTYSPVRGYGSDMVNVPYPGESVYLEDYEAPVGTRVYYRIVWTGGDALSTELTTRTVDAPVIRDTSYVWIKHPGLPALNRLVMMAATPAWERAGRSAMYQVVGRARPVVVSEVRASRTGTLQFHLWGADDHAAFNALMDSGQPILFQAAPGHGLDGNLYFAIDDVAWEPESWDATVPEYLWSLGVTEVDRPAGGIQGSASRTWQDVLDEFATWQDVLDAYDTWADVLTDTRRGGTGA